MVMPSPVQARAHATIRRAIEVAADIIEQRGEDGVRLQDVVDSSGVSAGSLTHHFGSREGLIAAALMESYDRAAQQRARSFDLDASDPDRFAGGMAAMISSAAAGERDDWRSARIRALSYSRHRPALRAALIASLVPLQEQMAERFSIAPERIAGGDAVCPRALVVFSEAYSAGRIVDTLFGDALPMEEWAALFARLVRGLVAAPVADAAFGERRAPVTWTPSALAPDDRPSIPRLDMNPDERRMLDLAIAVQRSSGIENVKVGDLVAETGRSRSWFARHFGEREEIVDHVHLCNLIGFSRRESELLEGAFDGASDPADLLFRLSDVIVHMSDPDVLGGAWNRMDLIAAAMARPVLAGQAAPIVHATLTRIAAAIAGAQQRGLVHPEVPPRAAARFLWAAPLAFVLGDVVGVEWPDLHALAVRAGGTLIA
jgi:AcrR family transcriptional regulator